MRVLFFLLFFSLILGCRNDEKKNVLLDDQVAEGNISKDTTYEGLIKFYDTKHHKLVSEAIYKNNVLEGRRVIYFPDGKKQVELDYENGEPLGFTTIYKEDGKVKTKQYFYYGLQVGPSIQYNHNLPKEYNFYSFDGKNLFHLDYDSIGKRRMDELQGMFFFFHRKDLQLLDFNAAKNKTEYFIYLVNPPKYKFAYSLCRIDSSYKVMDTLQTFDSGKVWETFFIDSSVQQRNSILALKLRIEDSVNGENMTMFKRLSQ